MSETGSENKSPLQDFPALEIFTGLDKMQDMFGDVSSSDLEIAKAPTEELTAVQRRQESDEVKSNSGGTFTGSSSVEEADKQYLPNISKSQRKPDQIKRLFGDISFSLNSSESDQASISKSQRHSDQIKNILGDISFSLNSSESDEANKTSYPNKSHIISDQIKNILGDISFSLNSSESDDANKASYPSKSHNISDQIKNILGDISFSLNSSESDDANKTSFPNEPQNSYDIPVFPNSPKSVEALNISKSQRTDQLFGDISFSMSSSDSEDANKSIHSIILEKRNERQSLDASQSRRRDAFQSDSLSDVEPIIFSREPRSPRPHQLFGNMDDPIVRASRKRRSSSLPDPVLRRKSQQFRPDPKRNSFLKTPRDRTFGKAIYRKERAKRRKLDETVEERLRFERYLKYINTESSGSDHVPDPEGRWRKRKTKASVYRKMWFRNLFHKYD